ncbi:CLUMA_CG018378, isoform A [Clunio marinus]|uniref:CLUMA_CG018378, isoform A n=1 Tax=Clunio marinus TaxID=568069 RepID=A0A1J1J104_9DIPT|nr:CLUMA_CG018378, isoform A [Clunio marinus]
MNISGIKQKSFQGEIEDKLDGVVLRGIKIEVIWKSIDDKLSKVVKKLEGITKKEEYFDHLWGEEATLERRDMMLLNVGLEVYDKYD